MINRILIGYDGSQCADAAIDDLRGAGLPTAGEALVVTAADVWLPTEIGPAKEDLSVELLPEIRKARELAHRSLEEAKGLSEAGAERVRALLPGWTVKAEACADSPSWALIRKAEERNADLLVVGSHGRSAVGRFIMGSVSQQVVHYAARSVRISRPRAQRSVGAPLRVLIGVDGSAEARLAVEAVGARKWPQETEVRVVTVADLRLTTSAAGDFSSYGVLREAAGHDPLRWMQTIAEHAADDLRGFGLQHVTSVIREGDPKRVLVDEANEWAADCIFVGAQGLSRLERLMIGSVSSSVVAHAPCTVEVVRRAQPQDRAK